MMSLFTEKVPVLSKFLVFWPKKEKKINHEKKGSSIFWSPTRRISFLCSLMKKSLIFESGTRNRSLCTEFYLVTSKGFCRFLTKIGFWKNWLLSKTVNFLYNERNRVIVQTLLLQHCRLFFNFCFTPTILNTTIFYLCHDFLSKKN